MFAALAGRAFRRRFDRTLDEGRSRPRIPQHPHRRVGMKALAHRFPFPVVAREGPDFAHAPHGVFVRLKCVHRSLRYFIVLGSQRAISGNSTSSASLTKSAMRNGTTPRKIVPIVTSSPATPLMMKALSPNGGWINPTSTAAIVTTPHQIGS